jgi:N-acylneuraminate cytidylyltransferase
MRCDLDYVALIPARGGSKGIPGKNIKVINGKPLIAWSIEHALAAKFIDRVVVSTDSDDIASVACSYGAEVPFTRPVDLSGDTASTESAMLHFCNWASQNGWQVDNLVLIQCTSPVRAAGRLDDAIRFFISGEYDSLVTVSPSHRFFWKNPDKPVASYDIANRPRRQDIPPAERLLIETGSLYITRVTRLLETGNRLCGKIALYETPEEEAYEIDSVLDFDICETMLRKITGAS